MQDPLRQLVGLFREPGHLEWFFGSMNSPPKRSWNWSARALGEAEDGHVEVIAAEGMAAWAQ